MFLSDSTVNDIVLGKVESLSIKRNPEDIASQLFEIKDGDIVLEQEIQSVYRIVNGKKIVLFTFGQALPVQSSTDKQVECRIVIKRIEPDEEFKNWTITFKKIKNRV